jgi:hypothetical protein
MLLSQLPMNMATTKATTNASTFAIQATNARALSYMERGMNQEAVLELEQAMRYLGTSLYQQQYYDTMPSSYYDCAQLGQVIRNNFNTSIGTSIATSEGTCGNPSASQTTSAVASSPVSNIGGARRSRDSNWIHEHAASLPQLRHGPAIYDCAFHLPFSDEMITSVEYRTQAIAVLFYNNAIAFHRYGIQSGKSEALGHASISYNAVLTMIGPHTLQLYPEIVVIILGLMCNLAHIHLTLRQVPEFLSSRAILGELMRDTPHDQMSKQDFAFFNFNLFCLDREDVRYAPAA